MKLLSHSPNVPAPRGPMMDAADVAHELFYDKVGAKWVKQNVPNGLRLGHSTLLWYRDDVLAWIEQQRESVA